MCKAIRQHSWIWYIWDPLALLSYGLEIIETTKTYNFASENSSEQKKTYLLVILASDIIEVLFNFWRARDKRRNLRETSLRYAKFLLWVDLLAIVPLDRIHFVFFILKIGKVRQMIRACDTIEHFVFKMVYNFPLVGKKNVTNFLVGRSYGKFAYILVIGILAIFVLSMLIITFRFDFIYREGANNQTFFSVFT